jgi:hypothetical protein
LPDESVTDVRKKVMAIILVLDTFGSDLGAEEGRHSDIKI